MEKIQWMTTAPNPRVISHSADAGQRGWVRHAVMAADTETFTDVRGRRALCGLLPAHGWDLDLFIEKECLRCKAAVDRSLRR